MPKGTEIERRFVIVSTKGEVPSKPSSIIEQGTISGRNGCVLRARVRSYDDGAIAATLTRKCGKGVTREENEEVVDPGVASLVMGAMRDMLTKRRIVLLDGGELDRFAGAYWGLMILEYELGDEGQLVVMPDWVHEYVEVTDCLTNSMLARDSQRFEGIGPRGITKAVLDEYAKEREVQVV